MIAVLLELGCQPVGVGHGHILSLPGVTSLTPGSPQT